jgi:lipopolysaccharide/colanic/teichoic acid biosynthesis glycosyltransferase
VVLATAVDAAESQWIVDACVERGVTFHSLAHMPVPNQVRHHAEALGDGLYLMSLESTPQDVGSLLVKRVVDVIGACAGLMLFGLVYLFAAPLIVYGSSGAVIFRQTRVGRNGRLFTLFKFRTMRFDAERQKAALVAHNTMRGHVFKMDDDPRVTPVGRILRRFYLDELPQFWNVLKGDMSLVGPRPPTQDEVRSYEPRHRRRLSVRPGLTGPWQTRGNGAVSDFEQVVRLECDYIDHWSLWSDMQMLLRTFLTVARRSGQ